MNSEQAMQVMEEVRKVVIGKNECIVRVIDWQFWQKDIF